MPLLAAGASGPTRATGSDLVPSKTFWKPKSPHPTGGSTPLGTSWEHFALEELPAQG